MKRRPSRDQSLREAVQEAVTSGWYISIFEWITDWETNQIGEKRRPHQGLVVGAAPFIVLDLPSLLSPW